MMQPNEALAWQGQVFRHETNVFCARNISKKKTPEKRTIQYNIYNTIQYIFICILFLYINDLKFYISLCLILLIFSIKNQNEHMFIKEIPRA